MMVARNLGWLITAFYFIQSVLTIKMPRTDKTLPLREDLRSWHYLIGMILLVLLGWRLWHWWKEERRLAAPVGVRPGFHNWTRTLALATYILLFTAPFFGILSAWSDGLTVKLGPWFSLPSLVAENQRIWMFTGYFHSGLSFMVLVINLAVLLTAAYGWLRYRRGLLAAFPDGFGAMAFLAMACTMYALATFKSADPGPAAVARYLGVAALVWAIGWFIHRNRPSKPIAEEAPGKARLASALAATGLVALGAYGPHAMFRVTPWPMGDVIAGPRGVTSHSQPKMRVQAWAETKYEREVAAQTYKWCGFCHTYTKNGQSKAGPPLYAIFGQRVASVPNFHYSPALAAARDKGLVWSDDKLDAFLANPDGFMPGTSMIISSGPVTDPKVRRAIINMLKRDTMQGAIDTVPAPEGQ